MTWWLFGPGYATDSLALRYIVGSWMEMANIGKMVMRSLHLQMYQYAIQRIGRLLGCKMVKPKILFSSRFLEGGSNWIRPQQVQLGDWHCCIEKKQRSVQDLYKQAYSIRIRILERCFSSPLTCTPELQPLNHRILSFSSI
ncbi:hypothetical protein HS088_TW04G00596 [Tripterygium wilfordii]|uniref:Uncharacterized protein n=1 Tax=Tripterygium wilfordii TaxID=458696 RepID=A0A7J7DQK4_TRIWF|nr:hypothetical protein HS088_TW04G00596 [Tripterygium wilfordii]